MRTEYRNDPTMDPSGFVLLADYVPHIVQEIRYYSTYNFIGERIDGYEEPCALLSIEAARALKAAAGELYIQGYRLKIFDAYRPARAVKHFVFWGLEDQDLRMKPYFYPDLDKESLFAEGYIAKQSGHSRGSAVDLTRNGFQPIDCEWWHFSLINEPYPDTYFNFPVSSAYLRR